MEWYDLEVEVEEFGEIMNDYYNSELEEINQMIKQHPTDTDLVLSAMLQQISELKEQVADLRGELARYTAPEPFGTIE
jgi:uncharacterized protein involved in exopolysaccharide biosynthesis